MILPSALGYGSLTNFSSIPVDAILNFGIEIVSKVSDSLVFSKDTAELSSYILSNSLNDTTLGIGELVSTNIHGISRKSLLKSEIVKRPRSGIPLRVQYTIEDPQGVRIAGTNDQLFEFRFASGEVFRGLDSAVAQMNEGEQMITLVPSEYGYYENVRVIPQSMQVILIEKLVIPGYVFQVDPFTPWLSG